MNSPSVAEWIDSYLEYLQNERGASRYTLTNYAIDLRHWVKFLVLSGLDLSRPQAHLTDLVQVRAFLAQESEKFKRATVSRRLSVIKGFLKFLYREGHLSTNVAKLIRLPKREERIPFVLRPEQIVALIQSIAGKNLHELRTLAMIELLYSTGIRISELVTLDWGHIDFRSGVAIVRGKGDKERVVPLGRHCQKAIRAYIERVPQSVQTGLKTPLFTNEEGERVSVRTLQRNLRQYAIEALGPVGMKVTPHTFRHSCATHLLAGGAGLREIQELLGHESLVTTQKYTQVDIQRLKRSYQAAHPRASQAKREAERESERKASKETKGSTNDKASTKRRNRPIDHSS